MLTKKDKTKLAGFYNYQAEKEKEEPYEIEWDQEEYENTIDMLETHNKYLYEKLQEADEKIDTIIKWLENDITYYEEDDYVEIPYNIFKENHERMLDILRGNDEN